MRPSSAETKEIVIWIGMNFIHAGSEFLSAENNNGDYETRGAKREWNIRNQSTS